MALALHFLLGEETWWYSFLFRRSFVQWVLISAFTVGLFYLLALRWPAWLREAHGLRRLETGEAPNPETRVGRRFSQIKEAPERRGDDVEHYVKNLAEHDEAEIDSAYRFSGDIVQVLPLIGFFGTVFGLSHGLYASFLTTGGTTTKDFAKAIAIAFDNTLLGLGLTIILFIAQSVLRKREEATLLQLNLYARDMVADVSDVANQQRPQAITNTIEIVFAEHNRNLKELQAELAKARQVLESPSEGVKAALQTHMTDVLTTIVNRAGDLQRTENARNVEVLSGKLEEHATKLIGLVQERAAALTQLGDPLRSAVAELKTQLERIAASMQRISERIALGQNLSQSQLEAVAVAMNALTAGLAQRDAILTDCLRCLNETKTKLDEARAEARTTSNAVVSFGQKLDAVPEERRKVEELAAAIKDLASALTQRDSTMFTQLKSELSAHSREIKGEIQRPRTIKFVEAANGPSHDGEQRG
jgi:hypothetical protein